MNGNRIPGHAVNKAVAVSVFAAVMFFCGCQRQQQVRPNANVFSCDTPMPSFLTEAFESTGSCGAWSETGVLLGECTVAFYDTEGGPYITRQHHRICPWSGEVAILADEPAGRFECSLSPKGFRALGDSAEAASDGLPQADCDKAVAEAVLATVTSPVYILARIEQFPQASEPLKVEDRFCRRIDRLYPVSSRSVGPIVFHQDQDTRIVDTVVLVGGRSGNFIRARGYDYLPVVKGAPAVPSKVEIFSGPQEHTTLHRAVEINYYRWTASPR